MENVDVYSAIPVKRGDVMISDIISHAQLLNKTIPGLAASPEQQTVNVK